MKTQFDYDKVRISWTKYDIVHALDLVESKEEMFRFYNKEAKIDEPIMRAFLGIKKIEDPIPEFWDMVFTWDVKDRRIFAFFRLLFLNSEVARFFAERCITGPFKGILHVDGNSKTQTNLRSLLVESNLSAGSYRRLSDVPFDGQRILNAPSVEATFKKSFVNIFEQNSASYIDEEFYTLCYANEFHSVLGLDKTQFRQWLEGHQTTIPYIQSLHFDRFMCFNQPCDLNFGQSKEIYIIGENGDGKTVLLMAIFAAFRYFSIMQSQQSVPMAAMLEMKGVMQEAGLRGTDTINQVYKIDSAPAFSNMFAYGTHRGRYSVQTDQKTYEHYGFMTLFDPDMTLHDPTDWILKQQLSPSNHAEMAVDNLARILSELLEQKVKIKIKGADVVYEEKGYALTLKQLSEGYRSILIFVCDLLIKLSEICPDDENVFHQHGVVLIDEIDQHLHPRWQRGIVKKLRCLFPNIQFIMTTHSPIIVLGSSEDAIFYRVIREEGTNYVSDPYLRKDMNRMMLNTLITSSLFGLSDASMDGASMDVDTASNTLISRIYQQVRAKIEEEKQKGKFVYTEENLDTLIKNIMSTDDPSL